MLIYVYILNCLFFSHKSVIIKYTWFVVSVSLNDGKDLITVKLLNVTVNKYGLIFVNLFCMQAPFQFCKYLKVFLNVHIPVNPDCRNSEMIHY